MTTITGLDAEVLPARPPTTGLILGYLAGPGAARNWPPEDWARARTLAGRVCPIYVPGSEGPITAAERFLGAVVATGQPKGTAVVLDREANRSDLDPAWCSRFAAIVTQSGYVPVGYTSGAYVGQLAGFPWVWMADPGAPAVIPAGEVDGRRIGGVQYLWAAGYDLSVFTDEIPFWQHTSPRPAPPASPTLKDDEMPFLAVADTDDDSAGRLGKVRKGEVYALGLAGPGGDASRHVMHPDDEARLLRQFGQESPVALSPQTIANLL